MAKKNTTSLNVVMSGDTRRLNKALTQSERRMKAFQRNVMSVAGGLGVAFGGQAIAQGIASSISKIADFEAEMSKVAAISGATGDNLQALQDDALALGQATKFTAIQVASLQVELSKLGFTSEEVINSTAAILDLAAATGEELATSAEVAGVTLRAFQLDAKEMSRVTDVMAASFTTSALDLEKFSNSMKFVAPIAKAAGVDIEFATAMLAKLADNSISGTMAGTSLRRILNEMGKTGLKTGEAFRKVASQGLTLEGAMDEVGRVAQTALTVLASNIGGVDRFAKSLDTAAGSTKAMADIVTDNLTGDLARLSSAWDGNIQKAGAWTAIMGLVVRAATNLLNAENNYDPGNYSRTTAELTELSRQRSIALEEEKKRIDEISRATTVEEPPERLQLPDFLMAKMIEQMNLEAEQAAIRAKNHDEMMERQAEIGRAWQEQAEKQAIVNQIVSEAKEISDAWIDSQIGLSQHLVTTLDDVNQAYSDIAQTIAEMPDLPQEQIDPKGYEDATAAIDERAMAQERLANITMSAADSIGRALGAEAEDRKRAINEMLRANASMILSELVRSAVASLPFPLNLVAGGTALIAGNALIGKIPALAEGGAAYGPTLALIGDNPGAHTNPEIVMDQRKLQKMIGNGGGGITVNVTGFVGDEMELGRELTNVLQNYQTRN
jgi:hypothetical protein